MTHSALSVPRVYSTSTSETNTMKRLEFPFLKSQPGSAVASAVLRLCQFGKGTKLKYPFVSTLQTPLSIKIWATGLILMNTLSPACLP